MVLEDIAVGLNYRLELVEVAVVAVVAVAVAGVGVAAAGGILLACIRGLRGTAGDFWV